MTIKFNNACKVANIQDFNLPILLKREREVGVKGGGGGCFLRGIERVSIGLAKKNWEEK